MEETLVGTIKWSGPLTTQGDREAFIRKAAVTVITAR